MDQQMPNPVRRSHVVFASWRDGSTRVLHAPALLGGVYVLTLVAAAPLALGVRHAIEGHLGRSLMANRAADSVNYDWWQEFLSQTSGVGATFSPAVIGFAATLDSLSGVLDARAPSALLVGGLAAYLLVWTFLAGGILDRYARRRPTRAHGFFAAAGVFFWRFLRLGLVAALTYWILFALVHPWLFGDVYGRLTRDTTAERVAFAWRFACYAIFGAALVAANVVFDYARIRLVVEDRRSAIGALAAALSFVSRRARRVLALYALNALLFVGVLLVWAFTAPGAGGVGVSMWAGFGATQIYVLARLTTKMQFMASQTALFQASLAHAGYTAAPQPAWPESAAAEAVKSHV